MFSRLPSRHFSRRAGKLERQLFNAWVESENQDPSDPYLALVLPRNCTLEQVIQAVTDRVRSYLAMMREVPDPETDDLIEACADGDIDLEDTTVWEVLDRSGGAVAVLAQRTRRAYQILGEPGARKKFDNHRRAKIKEKSFARLNYSNGIYEGGVLAGSMEGEDRRPVRLGRGVTVLENGSKHEGLYEDSAKHGIGLHIYSSGDLFLGHWDRDKIDGSGVYYYANGSMYCGEFKNDLRHGEGEFSWIDASTYRGQFEAGLRNGKGVLKLPVDAMGVPIASYDGEWKDGHFSGRGVFTLKDEGVYDGEFDTSRFHGRGREQHESGDVYEGTYHNGRCEGEVVYTWSNGDTFSGFVRSGKCEGLGTFTSARRGIAELGGIWKEGALNGKGNMSWNVSDDSGGNPGSHAYTGQFKEGHIGRHGEYSYPDGTKYLGLFERGKKVGDGEIHWPDGSRFRGTFRSDVRHGKARTNSEHGVRQELWEDNELVMCKMVGQ